MCVQTQKLKVLLNVAEQKTSAILKNVMGDAYLSDLVVRLQETKFSLIIDESTDISIQKHLVIIARFCDLSVQKTCDHFLCLLEVNHCTAQGIFSSIVQFFEMHLIPIKKCYRICQR